MEKSRFDRALDYFPILAYFGFWLQGAALAAVITGDVRLMALGLVTIPAVAAMVVAVLRIRLRHKESKA
jgi:uncharacterized membrane protein